MTLWGLTSLCMIPLLWQKSSAFPRRQRANTRQDLVIPTNLQQFKHVIPDIVIHKFWIQASEVRIVDILEDQGGCLALTISHHIQKRDNIGSTGQILEYLDLSLYLLLLHWLEDFDNAFLVVDNIYAFEDLRVLPSP